MKKDSNILKIPVNRILALVLMDVMSVIATSFAALYMRFDFRFKEIPVEYMVRFERIIPFIGKYENEKNMDAIVKLICEL